MCVLVWVRERERDKNEKLLSGECNGRCDLEMERKSLYDMSDVQWFLV